MPSGNANATLNLQAAAQRVVELAASGQGNSREAARLIDGQLGRWMDGIFRRLGVPEADAQEMTFDVWLKLLTRQYELKGNPLALLRTMANSRFKDYLRSRSAAKRTIDGGRAEVSGDDEYWDAILETTAGPEDMLALRDCLERMFLAYSRKSPQRAELLGMVAERLSYREIACVLFDISEDEAASDRKWEGRVRNRIEEARNQAAPFFEQCRE